MSWTKRFGTEQIKWLNDQGLGWPEKTPGEVYFPPEELTRENLPQRERHLQSELQRQRSSEKVEVLGLKFREGDLASWGAIFIVVLQIYFVIHLRELSKRSEATDEFLKAAWIGLYSGFLQEPYRFLPHLYSPLPS